MEYKTEFRIKLPEELLNTLGIDEDKFVCSLAFDYDCFSRT